MTGNDIGFGEIVKQCFALWSPTGCNEKLATARGELGAAIGGVTGALTQMRIRGLRDDARVVWLGYPLLAGADGTSPILKPIEDGVRALGMEGNRLQAAAVAQDNAIHPGQVTFLGGIGDAFAGHEPGIREYHADANNWIYGILGSTIKIEWYHPNPLGHTAYAAELFKGGTYGTEGRVAGKLGDIDVVFVIDTTGSMGGTINSVRNYATTMVADIQSRTNSARFAVVSYRDQPAHTGSSVDYPGRVDAQFTSDAQAVRAALAGLNANGGGDGIGDLYDPTPGWFPPLGFDGFQQPVDNPPSVNVMNAGKAVPFKFTITGQGDTTELAVGAPQVTAVVCVTMTGSPDEIENPLPAASKSGLTTDGHGGYTFVWKTDKTMAGTCQLVEFTLTDGTTHTALFQLR